MNGELIALKTAYEQEGLTPEQIAEDRALDLTAVKAGLMMCSSQYRKDCGQSETQDDGLNFTDDDLRRVNERILSMALSSEDENVASRLLIYIRDDKKGRKEAVKAVQNTQFNIFDLNQAFASAREGARRMKESLSKGKMIEA